MGSSSARTASWAGLRYVVDSGVCAHVHRQICTLAFIPPLPIVGTCPQKKEIAYIEQVLKLKIHHKLDIVQFRNKMYEKPKVGAITAHASLPYYMVA